MLSSCSRRVLKGVPIDGAFCRRLTLRELTPAPEKTQELHPNETEVDRDAAAQLIEEAKAEALRIKERAYQEGYEAGFREGLAQGKAAAQEILARAQAVLLEAEAERKSTINRLEKELLELAQEIARRIVAAELKVNREVVLAILKEALTLVRDRPYVLVLVHPDDLAICQEARAQFEALLPENAVLRILPDLRVERGGCLIDTGEGVVDATLGSRWAMLLEELKG